MPKLLHIPKILEIRNPTRSKKQLRLIIGTIIKSINIRLRQSHIVDINVRGIGRIKSHGNKKRNAKKVLAKDRTRKRKQSVINEFKPKNLLY